MKKNFMIVFILFAMTFTGCDGLVNDMENSALNLEDTALVVADLIDMGINSDGVLFTVSYNDEEVHIAASSSQTCASLGGDLYFPTGTTWEASFTVNMNGCEGSSGSILNGAINISLSGPQGSISAFGFSGTLSSTGATNGTVTFNLEYVLDYDCAVNWDCWSGSANGFTFAELYNAYVN